MLVPLTQSLYVPGKAKDADKVLIDVGACASTCALLRFITLDQLDSN